MKKLEGLTSEQQRACLELTMDNEWIDIFPEKILNPQQPPKQPDPPRPKRQHLGDYSDDPSPQQEPTNRVNGSEPNLEEIKRRLQPEITPLNDIDVNKLHRKLP